MRRWPRLLAAFAALASSSGTDGAPRPTLAIENVALVDVINGRLDAPRTVLCEEGKIAAIGGPGVVSIPAGALRIDGRGCYLTPGLIDMHVHLFNNASQRPPNEWAFPLFVANGVTAVREMRTAPEQVALVNEWRERIDKGELIAPRIVAAGIAAGAGSVEAARREVREAKAAGADFIKVFSEVPEPRWRAILEEARAVGMPVCGHIPAEVSAVASAEAGQRSNEHLMQLYEACSAREAEFLDARKELNGEQLVRLRDAQEHEVLDSFDQRVCDRAAAALAGSRQVQVPTLVLPYFEAHGDRVKFRDDPRWQSLRLDEQARWTRIFAETKDHDSSLAARRWEVSRELVRTLHKAHVPILTGTDTPMPLVYPGSSLHKELELLVDCGLSAAEAIRAATIAPAEFLGLGESYGSIATGKRADLVLLEADPLSDIRHTQRIRAVVLDGRWLPRRELDALSEH